MELIELVEPESAVAGQEFAVHAELHASDVCQSRDKGSIQKWRRRGGCGHVDLLRLQG